MTWLEAFVTTLVVELPLYWVVLEVFCDVRRLRAIGLAAAVNAVSHPLLWFGLLPWLGGLISATAAVLIGEAAVVAVEAAILVWAVRREQTALVAGAVVANAASFLVGVLLQQ